MKYSIIAMILGLLSGSASYSIYDRFAGEKRTVEATILDMTTEDGNDFKAIAEFGEGTSDDPVQYMTCPVDLRTAATYYIHRDSGYKTHGKAKIILGRLSNHLTCLELIGRETIEEVD